MGLMSRISRSIRALFGGIIESTENPELILQQTIRDMRDRVPELNNSVAQVMATEKLLAKSKERLEAQVVDLDSKIRASVKLNRDDIATAYIGQLQQAQVDLQKTAQQLEHATLASKQALKARDNYVLQMQRRTAEAMQLINQSKQAKLQEQLAQTMASFQIGDDASTFDEMRDKIDRRAAAAEARMQLGTASVDTQMQEIEREASALVRRCGKLQRTGRHPWGLPAKLCCGRVVTAGRGLERLHHQRLAGQQGQALARA